MPDTPPAPAPAPSPTPQAVVRRHSPWTFAWLLPIAAAALAGYAGWHAWGKRGTLALTLHFADGRGLRVTDSLRYRGIVVGEVERIASEPDLSGVSVQLRLAPTAQGIARDGSLFWIVHPTIGWGGIGGLDTLAGSRYIDVLPGSGAPRTDFNGLEQTPVSALCPPGGLEVIVQSATGAGIRAGSPVMYRQLAIGRVLSSGLSSDAGAVDIRLYVDPAYAALVRERTSFWADSGVNFHLGLKEGLSIGFDTPETLVSGGIAIATPPQAGEQVSTGHRFALQEQPKDWQSWAPGTPVGATVADGKHLPRPLATSIAFKRKELLISRERTHRGWALAVPGGLLGAAGLLRPDKEAQETTLELEVAGARFGMAGPPVWEANGLALLRLDLPGADPGAAWPRERMRAPTAPEDCLVIGDPALDPLAIAATRLVANGGAWRIDRSVAVEGSWHGAAVVARSDGALIGFLLSEDDHPRILTLPDPQGISGIDEPAR